MEAFLLDEAFIDWVKTPNEESDFFWKQFLNAYPEKREELEAASAVARRLNFERDIPAPESADKVWKQIMLPKESSKGKVFSFSIRHWWAAAAVLILVIGGLWFLGQQQVVRIETGIGEIRSIVLPDGSQVALKANSTLRFRKEWNSQGVREVWIEGAGFFDVVHLNKVVSRVKPAERFIVHLKNMDVEVLGTSFSVNSRQSVEKVVLQTGSIKVTNKEGNAIVYLKPGEMAQYSEERRSLSTEKVDTSKFSIQKNNRFKFDNTPLTEVLQLIEDTYGYKVVVQDSSLLERRFSGTISSQDEAVLLRALETMLNVKITVSGETVTISYK